MYCLFISECFGLALALDYVARSVVEATFNKYTNELTTAYLIITAIYARPNKGRLQNGGSSAV